MIGDRPGAGNSRTGAQMRKANAYADGTTGMSNFKHDWNAPDWDALPLGR